jgi:hypothetical protein
MVASKVAVPFASAVAPPRITGVEKNSMVTVEPGA